MDSVKRKARVGEKIVITNPRKGWNAHNDEAKGEVMTVNRVIDEGVYTEEVGIGLYINHEGYEVLEKS